MDTDRNLLFGVLALQLELINQEQFADACAGWAIRKDTSLPDLLIERRWITAQDRDEVNRLMERKVKKNQGDVRRSLGTVADAQVRDLLRDQADPAIRHSLGALPP